MTCILNFLNNTFFGTLFAGSLLAIFGLWLYRRQKMIDISFEDRRKIKEFASSLFSSIDIAVKDFNGQLNIYDNKNPQLKFLLDAVNQKFDNAMDKDFTQKFNYHIKEIEKGLNNLVAQIKFFENNKKDIINVLTENTTKLIIYLSAWPILNTYNQNDVEKLNSEFENVVSKINDVLQKLITQEI